jgi:hypothetical protein
LNVEQLQNLQRFTKRLPAGAEDATIKATSDGGVEFSAKVPGRVPGSYATYTKLVNGDGVTTGYFKTTIAPDGSTVHVKDKM